ncbi:MAG: hypothetical protein H3C45_06840 [Bacteroidia bacterium]|nr:hypothetical protein [Bacteroidia bacterium]
MSFIRFFLYLVLITVIQIGCVFLLQDYLIVKDVLKVILFFAILTFAIYPISLIGKNHKDPSMFVNIAYITIGFRFIMSMVYILYYKYTHDFYPKSFIFSFFISYVFYTIFEITAVTVKLRPNLNNGKGGNDPANK